MIPKSRAALCPNLEEEKHGEQNSGVCWLYAIQKKQSGRKRKLEIQIKMRDASSVNNYTTEKIGMD